MYVEDRTEMLCNRFLIKSLSNKNSDIYKKVLYATNTSKKSNRMLIKCIESVKASIIDNIDTEDSLHLYRENYYINTFPIPINTQLGKSLKESANPNLLLTEFLSEQCTLAIFTDGSKINKAKHVGSACYVPQLNLEISKSIIEYASVFTAECIAINQAMDIALQNSESDIYNFSDSLSVLQSLKCTKPDTATNRYIFEIKKKYDLFKLSRPEIKIQFYWLPSHRGVEGNEYADNLAKKATNKNFANYVTIPFTDYYEHVNKIANLSTIHKIKEQGLLKGKKYFELYFNETSKPWFHNEALSREIIVTINRMRSEHYHLAESLARIQVIDSPNCTCGKYPQNLNHVIWQCEIYDKERTKLIIQLRKLKFQLPLCIEIIINEPHIPACEYIHTFLMNCNLKI